MKAFLKILSCIWFFICIKATFFIAGKDFTIKKMAEQIVFYIKEDIKSMVDTVPDITISEANIIKIMLLEFYTDNFIFLKEEKGQLIKEIDKTLNNKIKWIIANK
tara:strand:- start:3 stop:317 length:315 start_codon:yes stop_codon:yes gene_type:complete